MVVGLAECVPLIALLFTYSAPVCRRPGSFPGGNGTVCLLRRELRNYGRVAIPNQIAAISVVSLVATYWYSAFRPALSHRQHTRGNPVDLDLVWGKHYITVVRDAFLQGAGWPATWPRNSDYRRHWRCVLYAGMAHHAADATQGVAISDGTNMRKFLQGCIANTRFMALLRKEFSQIRRDRRVIISLILPPILMILLFGFVLNRR